MITLPIVVIATMYQLFPKHISNLITPFYTLSKQHDYKIASLVLSLGSTLQKYPPFAATVIFEVYKQNGSDDDYQIKVYYISQTVDEPYTIEQLKLSPCGSNECKFNNFVSYLKPFENVTWKNECGLTTYDLIQLAEDNIGDS